MKICLNSPFSSGLLDAYPSLESILSSHIQGQHILGLGDTDSEPPPKTSACPHPPGHKIHWARACLSCLLKLGCHAGSSMSTVGSGRRWGAELQPCGWDALLRWLHCCSLLALLFLFLSNDGAAPRSEAKPLSAGPLPAAFPNMHSPTTPPSGLSGQQGRARLPAQVPLNRVCLETQFSWSDYGRTFRSC